MGRTIKLTDAQWEQLDHLRMGTASADVFRNCTIILMSAVGRSKASISNDLGCCTDTVARVRRLYRQGGAKALIPIKPPGRPSQTNAYRAIYPAIEAVTRDVLNVVAAKVVGVEYPVPGLFCRYRENCRLDLQHQATSYFNPAM